MRIVSFIFALLVSLIADAQTISPGRYAAMGDSCKNIHEYSKAISLYNKIDDNTKSASAYLSKQFGLAFCYKELGDYDKAESIYSHLIESNKRVNSATINLANLYNLTGRYEDAIRLVNKTDMSSDAEKRTLTLGNAYSYLGRNEQALEFYDYIISTTPQNESAYFIACNGKAYIELNKENYETAVPLFKQVVDFYDINNPRHYQALGNLALAKGLGSEKEEGLRLINQALLWQSTHIGKQHFDYIRCLYKKAQIQMSSGAKKEAAETYSEYFKREKDNIIRYFSTMTEKERLAYWKSKKSTIAQCYTLEEEAPELLYEVALFSKTIMLLSNSNFRKIVNNDAKTLSLYSKLEDIRRKQIHIDDKEEFAKLDQAAENLEKEILKSCDTYASFKKEMNISISDAKKALKAKNDVAIEFIKYSKCSENTYAALILDKSGRVQFCPLLDESYFDKKLKGTPYTINNIIEGNVYSAKDKLYKNRNVAQDVWSPILNKIPSTGKIYFAPDGIFHKFAIEYFCDSVDNGRNFKDIYRLSSTRTLLQRKDKLQGKLLLVGGVDYDDMSFLTLQEYANRNTSDILRRENMPPANDTPYPYLYGSTNEIDSICQRMKLQDITTIRNSAATEDSLKAVLGNFDIAHIATHGYTYHIEDECQSETENSADLSVYRSGIVLAGANKACSTSIQGREDGILSASEISELKLEGLKLIVLSACQTALGETSDEGPIGLIRGFKKSGAKEIVASLWEVSDEATLHLMTFFYEAISKGTPSHEALKIAQEKLRKMEVTEEVKEFNKQQKKYISKGIITKTPYDRPCFWAPFIIIDSLN